MATNKQPPREYPGVSIAAVGPGVTTNGGRICTVPLAGVEYMSLQGVLAPGSAWSSGIVSLRVGNSPHGDFVDLPTPVTITNAAKITTVVDVRGYSFAQFVVTTAESGVVLNLYACLYGQS